MNENTNCVCNFTINGICYSANISRTHCYKQYITGDQLGKKIRITHWEYAYMLNAFEYGADSDLANEQSDNDSDAAYIEKAYEELNLTEVEWAEDHIEIVNAEQKTLVLFEAFHYKGIFLVSFDLEGMFQIQQFDNEEEAMLFARKAAIDEARWQKEQRRTEYEAELAKYEIAPGVREIGNVYYINGREDEVAEIIPSYVGNNKVVWDLIRRGGAHLLFDTYDTIEEARQVARAHSICIHKLLNQ